MALIKPFRPLRYTEKAGDIKFNVCPPYDIVSGEQREALCKKSQSNLIRLELPEGEDKYNTAKALLNEFIEKGILKRDDKDGIFIYEEEFEIFGENKVFDGLVCLCKTYDFSENVVLPHEETLSKAKQDRFDLMSTTFCNFSSVYSLFDDKTGYIQSIIDKKKQEKPLVLFADGEGVTHRMWKIEDEESLKNIVNYFADKKLYIADGHHRYETAGNFNRYCKENGINCDSGFVMMTLVDMANKGLVVLPTHRVLVNMSPDMDALYKKAAEYFDITLYNDKKQATEALEKANDKNAFLIYTKGGAYRLLVLKEACLVGESAVERLDVSVLHTLVLEKLLGIDRENLKNQKNLIYTRSFEEAIDYVENGASPAAFILNPTKVSEIRDVASEGNKMPQKSTYFYPKLITGLLINKFKD